MLADAVRKNSLDLMTSFDEFYEYHISARRENKGTTIRAVLKLSLSDGNILDPCLSKVSKGMRYRVPIVSLYRGLLRVLYHSIHVRVRGLRTQRWRNFFLRIMWKSLCQWINLDSLLMKVLFSCCFMLLLLFLLLFYVFITFSFVILCFYYLFFCYFMFFFTVYFTTPPTEKTIRPCSYPACRRYK